MIKLIYINNHLEVYFMSKKNKEECKMKKELRALIAQRYGFEGFEYKECEYDGDCSGTCPACEAEEKRLKELVDDAEAKLKKTNNNLIMGQLEPMPPRNSRNIVLGETDDEDEDIEQGERLSGCIIPDFPDEIIEDEKDETVRGLRDEDES